MRKGILDSQISPTIFEEYDRETLRSLIDRSVFAKDPETVRVARTCLQIAPGVKNFVCNLGYWWKARLIMPDDLG
jgi:hypothetical protein